MKLYTVEFFTTFSGKARMKTYMAHNAKEAREALYKELGDAVIQRVISVHPFTFQDERNYGGMY